MVKYMKKKNISIAIALVLLAFLLYLVYDSYASSGSSISKKALITDVNDMNAVVSGNIDFALSLFDRLKDDENAIAPKGNLFFSPYSISNALAIVYGGTRGQTKEQIAAALHFTLPDQNFYSAFDMLQKQPFQNDMSRGYQLLLANALWYQKGEPFLKDFLDLTQNYYGGGLNQLDFVNETEKSRQKINSWIEEKTKDKIKDLILPNGINKETTMVLTNAIYFKGEWKTKFSWWKTKDADFTVSANKKVKVPLMHIKEKFNCCSDANSQVLELPYKNDEISMLVILPKDTEGIKKVENAISAEYLKYLLSKMKLREVDAYFPKFKMTWGTFCLNKILSELGMPDAFNPGQADFSGINGKKDLWISVIFHKAFIEVNEKGTEATAAMSVGLSRAKTFPFVFRADHPFIFLIKDNRSGSILFMGRVMNPTE
jgi:serpin B